MNLKSRKWVSKRFTLSVFLWKGQFCLIWCFSGGIDIFFGRIDIFFEGTPFLRRGRQFIDFSPKSRRFALASGKISESQRKKICKRAEVPPKSLSKQNSKNKKKRSKWRTLMIFFNVAEKLCANKKIQINPANRRIYKNVLKQ